MHEPQWGVCSPGGEGFDQGADEFWTSDPDGGWSHDPEQAARTDRAGAEIWLDELSHLDVPLVLVRFHEGGHYETLTEERNLRSVAAALHEAGANPEIGVGGVKQALREARQRDRADAEDRRRYQEQYPEAE